MMGKMRNTLGRILMIVERPKLRASGSQIQKYRRFREMNGQYFFFIVFSARMTSLRSTFVFSKSFCLSECLSVLQKVFLSFRKSFCTSESLSVFQKVFLSYTASLFVVQKVFLSFRISFCLSECLPVFQKPFLSFSKFKIRYAIRTFILILAVISIFITGRYDPEIEIML